ncbi:hypothetical protein [Paenibacillus planticolens]|uniref:Uncharacterized protein n=1 Tax=Paenibacillus planticolens TaxID=2654976 RepID=A0ABX1ZFY0_9BACL|nr:hypothetical protein [Paenibacillus planticolens]NOU98991.1 hypothetical protein [Paenibacillus planticolens]
MRKMMFRSLIFAILLVIGYYAVQVFWGYYITLKYVPDISNSSSAIDFGSHKVEFGIKASPLNVISEIMIIMAIGVVIYISGSYVTKKITTS